jgi:hypothetical protein
MSRTVNALSTRSWSLLPAALLVAAVVACGDLPKVGDPLPPIVGSTLDGERVDNDSLHGRTVLLNLWFIH